MLLSVDEGRPKPLPLNPDLQQQAQNPEASTHLYPRKNLDAGSVRVPSALTTVNVAPNAIHRGLRSEMGLAVAMLPPRVPVFLI